MSEEALDAIPQRQVLGELELPPSPHEVTKAIKQTSSGKSPGADGIPAEIYKHGGDYMRRKLTHLFKLIWDKGTVPQEFKDLSIVHLYKRKGDRTCCDNHRGISLLAVAGKILARIVLNRMTEQLVNSIYPESQCGFRPAGRGTTTILVHRITVHMWSWFYCLVFLILMKTNWGRAAQTQSKTNQQTEKNKQNKQTEAIFKTRLPPATSPSKMPLFTFLIGSRPLSIGYRRTKLTWVVKQNTNTGPLAYLVYSFPVNTVFGCLYSYWLQITP